MNIHSFNAFDQRTNDLLNISCMYVHISCEQHQLQPKLLNSECKFVCVFFFRWYIRFCTHEPVNKIFHRSVSLVRNEKWGQLCKLNQTNPNQVAQVRPSMLYKLCWWRMCDPFKNVHA